MSDFHGGFFVHSLEASVAEPIRLALVQALRARGIDPESHGVTFAAQRECPVMHVAVRGPLADGKDYAFFHHQHSEIGAAVARAAGVDVWAYHYENQSGSESVRSFGPDGRELGNVYCSWDDEEERPLGLLAQQLGIGNEVLELDLGYSDDLVRVPLTGGPCTDTLAEYLAAPLRDARLAVKPESLGQRQTLYFPRWMREEFEAHARRLDVSVGKIVWTIWEAAKPELFRTVPMFDEEAFEGESTAPPRFMVPPPNEPPADVVVPRLVPVFAKVLPEPPSADDKVQLAVTLSERVLKEIQDFAVGADRSLSWSVQKAYVLVRDRVHAATKP